MSPDNAPLRVVPFAELLRVSNVVAVVVFAGSVVIAAVVDLQGWRYAGWSFIAGVAAAAVIWAIAKYSVSTSKRRRSGEMAVLPENAEVVPVSEGWRYLLSRLGVELIGVLLGFAALGAWFLTLYLGFNTCVLILQLTASDEADESVYMNASRWLLDREKPYLWTDQDGHSPG